MTLPVRVLVVDDSALMRRLIASLINHQADMRCVGEAADAYEARERVRTLSPDVVTLDVEMPGMDGLQFLERLMRLRPMPVVMVSTLTASGTDATLRALELGAVDFVTKPQVGQADAMSRFSADLIDRIRVAAQARVRRHAEGVAPMPARPPAASVPSAQASPATRLVCMGASTGGTEALHQVLGRLPASFPAGILVAQHMPPAFTAGFARRLDAASALQVREAAGGEPITPGCVWVAPGGRHLTVVRRAGQWFTALENSEPVNRHRPSVDVLFRSAVRHAGRAAIGVLLTGMGADGAKGLLEMRQSGAHTIAQDQATSVVWGMPRAAQQLGAAVSVLPLERIASALLAKVGVTGHTA